MPKTTAGKYKVSFRVDDDGNLVEGSVKLQTPNQAYNFVNKKHTGSWPGEDPVWKALAPVNVYIKNPSCVSVGGFLWCP